MIRFCILIFCIIILNSCSECDDKATHYLSSTWNEYLKFNGLKLNKVEVKNSVLIKMEIKCQGVFRKTDTIYIESNTTNKKYCLFKGILGNFPLIVPFPKENFKKQRFDLKIKYHDSLCFISSDFYYHKNTFNKVIFTISPKYVKEGMMDDFCTFEY